MPAFRALIVVSLTLLLLAGCSQPPRIHKIEGLAEGTSYHISWWSSKPVDEVALRKQMDRALALVDKEISTYRDDSDLQKFNLSDSTDWQPLPGDVIRLMAIAKTVHRQSGGCYDPTIKPLFDLWGFHGDKLHVPSDAEIENTLADIGFDKVELDAKGQRVRKALPNISVDLSSMGEGYTIWQLTRVFEKAGVGNYLVEFGGDMLIAGHKPDGKKWRIAIERPTPGDVTIQKTVTIDNTSGVSVNTSGTYRHFFDDKGEVYSHILDPRTGRPVTHHLVSATVFGNDPRITDAWATAMLCMGREEGESVAKQHDIEVFFIQQRANDMLTESQSPALRDTRDVTIN